MAGWTNTSNGTTWILTSLDWVEQSCVFYELAKVMQTGFNEPIITKQVISNIAFGGICFVLAWLMFGPAINHTVAGGVTRGTVLKSTSRVKFLSPGRVWSNPLVWKDFQFIGGGYSLFVVKLVLYLVLLATLTVVSQYPGNWLNLSWDDLGSAYFVTMLVILLVEACILASRIFHDEVRLQTLSSLLMLPRSIPYLAYSKAIGCLLGLLPAGICLIVSLFLLPETHLLAIWNALIEPGLWGAVGGVLIFLHLVALLSLFVRWGALPLAVFLMGPILMCCPFPQLVFLVGSAGMQDFWAKIPATITVWILNGMVCFVFQMMIGSRLEELGTK